MRKQNQRFERIEQAQIDHMARQLSDVELSYLVCNLVELDIHALGLSESDLRAIESAQWRAVSREGLRQLQTAMQEKRDEIIRKGGK